MKINLSQFKRFEKQIVLKKIGSWTATIKKYFSDMQSGMNEITNFKDFDEKDKNLKDKRKKYL